MPPLFAVLRSPAAAVGVVEVAREFSPRVQRNDPACAVCDVSGLGRLLGTPEAIGTEIARTAAAYGVPMQIAVAPTMTMGLVLTLQTLEAGVPAVSVADDASVLAVLPLRHLERLVCGALTGTTAADGRQSSVVSRQSSVAGRQSAVGSRQSSVDGRQSSVAGPGASRQETSYKRYARAFDMARRWGLRTIGELAALPPGELSARMGQEGMALQQLALGRDPGPLVPDPDIPRFIGRMELEWPLDTLEPLSFVLARLLEPLSSSLERADRGAAALHLELRLVDRAVHTRALQLPVAMRDPRVLRTLLLLDLESHPPPAAVDIVTVEIDPAPGRVIQYSLLEKAVPSAETVATLTARLSALVGERNCGAPAVLDTYRPDGFELRRFELPDAAGPARGSPGAPHPDEGGTMRRGTAAVLPPVLRRFRPPVAVRVTVAQGRPAQVAIDRRGMPGGAVERCAGPWRTSGAWWDPEPARWDRDEWDVSLRDGTLCRLYCERGTGTWFMDGVLD